MSTLPLSAEVGMESAAYTVVGIVTLRRKSLRSHVVECMVFHREINAR